MQRVFISNGERSGTLFHVLFPFHWCTLKVAPTPVQCVCFPTSIVPYIVFPITKCGVMFHNTEKCLVQGLWCGSLAYAAY